MDSQRLEELINAAGYTAEAYRHHGPCVSVQVKMDDVAPMTVLANIVYCCGTVPEASDLVRRCHVAQTPTHGILYWPHAAWVL